MNGFQSAPPPPQHPLFQVIRDSSFNCDSAHDVFRWWYIVDSYSPLLEFADNVGGAGDHGREYGITAMYLASFRKPHEHVAIPEVPMRLHRIQFTKIRDFLSSRPPWRGFFVGLAAVAMISVGWQRTLPEPPKERTGFSQPASRYQRSSSDAPGAAG